MANSGRPEEVGITNERSLKTLLRAVTLSEGQFALILVRCNYVGLQETMKRSLQEMWRKMSDQPIWELVLPKTIKTLFTTTLVETRAMASVYGNQMPPLMIFGFESVIAIDHLLISTNQVRDEFRKSLNLPIVLWLTDEVLQKLTRFAPDFKSWAAASIKFDFAPNNLMSLWEQTADDLFTKVLENGVGEFLPNDELDLAPGNRRRQELESAQKDLQIYGISLEPTLEATRQFIVGRDAYANDQIDIALEYYHHSLCFWQQLSRTEPESNLEPQFSADLTAVGLKIGILLFHIGLSYFRKADLELAERESYWEEARNYFQQGVEVFEQQGRTDLVAQTIGQLGEVLRSQSAWDDLQALAQQSLKQAETYGNSLRLAQAYGFLAEVAQKEGNWLEAKRLAQIALQNLAGSPGLHNQLRGLYLLILASAQQQMGQQLEAINNLELAKEETYPPMRPQLYIDLLEALRLLYFEQHRYLEAFELKQEQRSIEQQYGFSTFLGACPLQAQRQLISQNHESGTIAQEILAAGRQQDINRLIERISRNDHKLTVIHGASGVGKSSLINAGLVPALKGRIMGAREVVPLVQQVYTDWIRELGRRLAIGRGEFTTGELGVWHNGESGIWHGEWIPNRIAGNEAAITNCQSLIEQLRQNAEQNLLTVLIFDQFEEFFFVCTAAEERKRFYELLRDCLNMPFIKVILSLRTDFLHYLLECERQTNLGAINNNILDKNIRYCLDDLSPQDATSLIVSLTNKGRRGGGNLPILEDALIEAFVRDLAAESGTVRLIELQVVGAQLQADKVRTLEQYQQLGSDPISELVRRSLEKVIVDCGPENEDAVWAVLFALTNERGNRPLKTKPELTISHSSFIETGESRKTSKDRGLNLILNILIGSGLVVRIPEKPENRYQLVHDYLVMPIRQGYEQRTQLNIKQQIAIRERELRVVRKEKLRAIAVGVVMAILALIAGGLAWQAETARKRATIAETSANLSALSASSEALFVSDRQFDALLEGLRAARLLKKTAGIQSDIRATVVTALQQAVYGVRERNRLEGHTDVIWHVSFSPNGQLIVSSSRDKTLRIWRKDGSLVKTLIGHTGTVTSASFSPDSKNIASSSWDSTVKIWQNNGKLIKSINTNSGNVLSVSWSPKDNAIASASEKGTIKLWTANGKLIKTLKAHQGPVTGVSFSPNGQILASAGEDKIIKIWRRDRQGQFENRPDKILKSHTGKVNYISFSSDGKNIATASDDKTVKLWDVNTGKLLKTFQGHKEWVYSVSFSPDGKSIASSSEDNTIGIWQRDSKEYKVLGGHGDGVTSVQFSPKGEMLVSASYDKTVKIWGAYPVRPTLKGHKDDVSDVSFSPDGQMLATASKDETAKLWNIGKSLGKPRLYKTLIGHTQRLYSVSFSPDGQMLLTTSKDKTTKLWNRDGKLIKTLIGHEDWVLDASFSADGQIIASASRDNTVKLWTRAGELIRTLKEHGDRVNAIAFSADGKLLATASDDRTVKVWTVDGRLLTTLKGHTNWVLDVTFSPNSQILASASYDNTVKLWKIKDILDTNSPRPYLTLVGSTDSVAHVKFSPDGQILATTTWDNRVQLWRLDDTLIKSLEGHNERVTAVTFSPDGKSLATASMDNTAILWNLNLEDLLNRSCSWLKDYLKTNQKVRSRDRKLCNFNQNNFSFTSDKIQLTAK